MPMEVIFSGLSSAKARQSPFRFQIIAASISEDRNKRRADWWMDKIEAYLPSQKHIRISEMN
jgi:hypothetical protein